MTNERLSQIMASEGDDWGWAYERKDLARQIIAARSILSEWAQKEGHALCHQHPEILARLAHALEVPVRQDPPLPTRPDFEVGCRAYHDFLYERNASIAR